jgi:outer membrane protein, heavy metal efflux system
MKSMISTGLGALMLAVLTAGCAVRPKGEADERRLAAEIGKPYERSFEERNLPPLPVDPTWQDVLRRAFVTNGELEGAYWEWKAALERVPQESSQMTTLAFNFEYLLRYDPGDGGGGAHEAAPPEDPTVWDRTTLGVMNDPMANIELPGKPAARGRKALAEARAAFRRFEVRKFALQADVLKAWYEWAQLSEALYWQAEIVSAHDAIAGSEDALYRAGKVEQAMLLEHHNTLDLEKSELEGLRARVPGVQARLNAFMGRAPGDSLLLPSRFPAPRTFTWKDDEFLAMVGARNPEVQELAQEVKGKEEALTIARQRKIPDFGLEASITGSISSMIGGMITAPFLRRAAIRGAVEEARAEIAAMNAYRRQKAGDVAAEAVMSLTMLRYLERRISLFEGVILDRASLAVRSGQAGYEAGTMKLSEWQESRVELLETERMLSELRMERESRVAELERLAAVDVDGNAAQRASPSD